MAGDWIKMRGNLWDDPRISRICDLTDQPEAMVVGGLYWLWAAADQHTEDGVMPGLTLRGIDRKTGIQGFGEALVTIGWLADHPEGVRIVNFEEHNGESAKRRCADAKRKANSRGKSDDVPQDVRESADTTRTENGQARTDCGAREEKRREEKKEEKETGAAKSQRPSRKCPSSFEPQDPQAWIDANCPGLDWQRETEKFRDHTFKTARTDWLGTWRNWMRGAFDDRPKGRAPPTSFHVQDMAAKRAVANAWMGSCAPTDGAFDDIDMGVSNARIEMD